MQACWNGERSADYRRSRARHGIARESVWLQSTPAGELGVVLIQAEDIGRAIQGLATSDDAFDRWFRQHVLAVHGVDLTAGMSPPELLLDFTI